MLPKSLFRLYGYWGTGTVSRLNPLTDEREVYYTQKQITTVIRLGDVKLEDYFVK